MKQEEQNAIVKHGTHVTLKHLMQDNAIGQSFLWLCKINKYRNYKEALIPVTLVSVNENKPGQVMVTPDKGYGAFSVEHTEIFLAPTRREISIWLKRQMAETEKARLLEDIKSPFLRQSFTGLKQSLNSAMKKMSKKEKKIATQESEALGATVKGDEIKVTSRYLIECLIKAILSAVYGVSINESEMKL